MQLKLILLLLGFCSTYLLIVRRFFDYMLIGFVCAMLLKVKFKLLWTACLHVYMCTSLCTSALPLLCCSAVVAREVVVEAIHIFWLYVFLHAYLWNCIVLPGTIDITSRCFSLYLWYKLIYKKVINTKWIIEKFSF